MGEWIGAAGGAMMIALIVVLLLRFLSELGCLQDVAGMKKWLPRIAGIGLLELMLCGIYYTVKVNGTSILDFKTIWSGHSMILQAKYPVNWYVSMLCGVAVYWNLYRILCRFLDDGEAENGLYLCMAVPGSYLLFLPFWCSLICLIASTLLRVALPAATAECYQNCRNALHPLANRLGSAGYLSILSVLAILNGASIIKLLGV